MGDKKTIIHEVALENISELFDKEGVTLKADIKKDDITLYDEYGSDCFSLMKFHGTTYGIKRREVMPPVIKFTIDSNEYNIELVIKGGLDEVNSVMFREIANLDNYIYLEVK